MFIKHIKFTTKKFVLVLRKFSVSHVRVFKIIIFFSCVFYIIKFIGKDEIL